MLFENGVYHPEHITSKVIRTIFGDLIRNGYADSYVNNYARVLRTFTKFLYKEKYILHIPVMSHTETGVCRTAKKEGVRLIV